MVATPIGNLGDMTTRAAEILRSVNLIAAEDTRHSSTLLSHLSIKTPMVSYHDYTSSRGVDRLIERLLGGDTLALISDAGTPLISDPGYRLIRACHQASVAVIPVPGPSSVTAALSVAGLPTDKFYFEGFLPVKSRQRASRINALKRTSGTLIFLESPRRLKACLATIESILGNRDAALCRELTKVYETVRLGTVSELRQWVDGDANQQKGEIILLVGGFVPSETLITDEAFRWLGRLAGELPPRRVAAIVSDVTGVPARELYQALLSKDRNS